MASEESEMWQEKFPLCDLILLKTAVMFRIVNAINDARKVQQKPNCRRFFHEIH